MSAEMLSIRRTAPEDCHPLCALVEDDGTNWGFEVPVLVTPQWWHARFVRNENHGISAVAELDGRVVGYVELLVDPLNCARRHVGSISVCVHPAFRRRGIGRALLERAVTWSNEVFGLARLELFVWADHAEAMRLYQSLGFVVEGMHQAFGFRAGVHADAVSMARLMTCSVPSRCDAARFEANTCVPRIRPDRQASSDHAVQG